MSFEKPHSSVTWLFCRNFWALCEGEIILYIFAMWSS